MQVNRRNVDIRNNSTGRGVPSSSVVEAEFYALSDNVTSAWLKEGFVDSLSLIIGISEKMKLVVLGNRTVPLDQSSERLGVRGRAR